MPEAWHDGAMVEIVQRTCDEMCTWRPTDEVRDGELIFHCLGCGSEWAPSEEWIPINHDGVVHPAVQAAVDSRRG